MKPTYLPVLRGARVVVRLLDPAEAHLMVDFRHENRDHLKQWEPTRSPQFFTEPYWRMQLRHSVREFREGVAVPLVVLDAAEAEVLGVCNFTNIVRGTFQSCHLGYALAARHEGGGIMREALELAIDYLFAELHLHRIMANYLPHNARSAALLQRLGFEIEGRARAYLRINGRWEDHVLTSRINPRTCD